MAYIPILFNTEMVQAIQAGRKTQTRRIIKLTPGFSGRQVGESGNPDNPLGFMYPCGIKRPPCNKGDILWVRETWHKDAGRYMYRANYSKDEKFYRNGQEVEIRWSPSIHMPKAAARIFLRVKDVRVERLTDTTDKDAAAEGVPDGSDYPVNPVYCPFCSGTGTIGTHHPDSLGYMPVVCPECDTPKKRFSYLWDSTIKPADLGRYGWAANPWVWVIEFERCEKPEGWPNV